MACARKARGPAPHPVRHLVFCPAFRDGEASTLSPRAGAEHPSPRLGGERGNTLPFDPHAPVARWFVAPRPCKGRGMFGACAWQIGDDPTWSEFVRSSGAG